jgi:hypothetical protein
MNNQVWARPSTFLPEMRWTRVRKSCTDALPPARSVVQVRSVVKKFLISYRCPDRLQRHRAALVDRGREHRGGTGVSGWDPPKFGVGRSGGIALRCDLPGARAAGAFGVQPFGVGSEAFIEAYSVLRHRSC